MVPVGRGYLPPLLDGVGEHREHRFRVLPANAGVGDADAVLETRLALFRDLLVACSLGVSLSIGSAVVIDHIGEGV